MASREGTPSLNTVNNNSVQNSVNNTCTSGCGGSSFEVRLSWLSPQCGE
jgi:hypothetical protein